jgi:predicted nucleic-acid-binding protein
LVRFLTNDDRSQALAAKHLLEARTPADPAYVNIIVLVEALWVLQHSYRCSRTDVSLIVQMLAIDQFRFEKAPLVAQAVRIAVQDDLDLPDTLIATLNDAAGCTETRTFDRCAARIPGMAPV